MAACALVLAAALAGCAAPKAPKAPKVPVTLALAESRVVPHVIEAPATVEAIQNATVHSPVGGTIERLEFREGDDVAAGQILYQLDARPFAAAYEQARGAYERDRAQYTAAAIDADRAHTLLMQQLMAPADEEQKRASAEGLRASVAADSGSMVRARLDLQYASIRAPISGRTGESFVHVGDLVRANASDQTLVEIRQLHPIRVRFTISAENIDAVRAHGSADARVHVRSASSDSLLAEGRLVFIDHAVDEASGTVLLKAECANSKGELWPGEPVRVQVELTAEHVRCAVPTAAVTLGQQGAFVFVVAADSTVKMQPVKVALESGDWSVIAKGLDPGQVVVTDGQFRLAPGGRITLRPGAPALGAAAPGRPVTK